MQLSTRIVMTGAAFAGLAAPAAAQSIDLTVTIPRLSVAEYHRPYVAIWLEKTGASAKTLAVWYDHDMRDNEGTKWLRDVRQWWRASGRGLSFPADGITGATKAPGTHKVSFGADALGTLEAGQYTLLVEAAREVGGRELVKLPFSWPPKAGAKADAAGSTELGAVSAVFNR
ncbi:DUF2271 domain-containing protein [Sphingosinicella microcystinivorans]|uniref:DUF2271 domain-containing protein n=1 Tax=Sphingosinicella microcystinivorans TaxID=335406 RepID=A0AAD1G218_SPHMI|nr:DUF2271 domain-containing protein [Sphingosinicella microcystinivorans]RKS92134.1 hypothetical protein DFR51_1714 [Sphingosinicella microcystinivorans]BBE35156.1 hypothetical protein SmB9_28140 [Sphingosinicella microcystinivorans]